MANDTLREQQKEFVNEYLKLRKKNATQAAINAGYSSRTASSQASQLLKNPKVMDYLDEQEKAIDQELRQEFVFDALEARKVMNAIMNDEGAKDSDRLTAAKDFLDRAGFKAIDEVKHSGSVDISNPYAGLSEEELRRLANGSNST